MTEPGGYAAPIGTTPPLSTNGFGQWLTIPYSSYAAAADAANRLSATPSGSLVGFDAEGSDPGAADLIAALRTELPDGDISPATATLIREMFEQSITDDDATPDDDKQGSEPVPERNIRLAAERPEGYVPAETATRMLRDGETLAAGHIYPVPGPGVVSVFVWLGHSRTDDGGCYNRVLPEDDYEQGLRPGGYSGGFVRCPECSATIVPEGMTERLRDDDALLRVASSRPDIPEPDEQ